MAHRVNKTKVNLQTVWEHLDQACGSLDHATHDLSLMVELPSDITQQLEQLDISRIISLKNQIEELIDSKDEKINTY